VARLVAYACYRPHRREDGGSVREALVQRRGFALMPTIGDQGQHPDRDLCFGGILNAALACDVANLELP